MSTPGHHFVLALPVPGRLDPFFRSRPSAQVQPNLAHAFGAPLLRRRGTDPAILLPVETRRASC